MVVLTMASKFFTLGLLTARLRAEHYGATAAAAAAKVAAIFLPENSP
jgi:hypothetical protein